MKTKKTLLLLVATMIATMNSITSAADAKNSAERIGIYDSRVIAYAHFWSDPQQRKLADMMREARTARAAGQTNRFSELSATIKKEQDLNHLRVFSTAPVDSILDEMKDRVKAIEKEAGVSRLVSKWDERALQGVSKERQTDVTDLFVAGFTLNERQKDIIADMRKKDPLPLETARKLLEKGDL
jgi:hypothetical protein